MLGKVIKGRLKPSENILTKTENEFWQSFDIESETNAKETTLTEITDSDENSEHKSNR